MLNTHNDLYKNESQKQTTDSSFPRKSEGSEPPSTPPPEKGVVIKTHTTHTVKSFFSRMSQHFRRSKKQVATVKVE